MAVSDLTTSILLLKLWPIIVFLIGLVSACGVYAYRVNQHGRRISEISDGIKTKLYTPEGETIYMPRNQCKECRDDCGARRRDEMDDVKRELRTISSKMDDISEFVGEVRQYMKQGR